MGLGQVYQAMATVLGSVMVAGGRIGGAAHGEALRSMEGTSEASGERADVFVITGGADNGLERIILMAGALAATVPIVLARGRGVPRARSPCVPTA